MVHIDTRSLVCSALHSSCEQRLIMGWGLRHHRPNQMNDKWLNPSVRQTNRSQGEETRMKPAIQKQFEKVQSTAARAAMDNIVHNYNIYLRYFRDCSIGCSTNFLLYFSHR